MPQKLETVLKKVEELSNNINTKIIYEYHNYLVARDTSTNYQKDNVRLVYMFAILIVSVNLYRVLPIKLVY